MPSGIMGVGPFVNGVVRYPLVLDSLATQGVINSRAFSLDLRGVDSPDGTSPVYGFLRNSNMNRCHHLWRN